MSSLHVILDTKNRHWTKPPIDGVYCAVLDIGEMAYADKSNIRSCAHALAELLLVALSENVFQEDGVCDASSS